MLLDHQVGWPSMWFLGQLDGSPASSRAHPPGWRIMRFHGELNNKKPQKHSNQRNILRNHWSFRAILNGILSDGSPKHNHCIAMNRTCRFDTFSICKTLWKSPRRKFPNHINHPGIDREPFIPFNLFRFSFALFRIVSIPSSNNNSVGFCTLFFGWKSMIFPTISRHSYHLGWCRCHLPQCLKTDPKQPPNQRVKILIEIMYTLGN